MRQSAAIQAGTLENNHGGFVTSRLLTGGVSGFSRGQLATYLRLGTLTVRARLSRDGECLPLPRTLKPSHRSAHCPLLLQRNLSGAALLLFDAAADFQQAIQHFGAFRAAGGELGVGLFVEVFQSVKLVGNVQRCQNRDFQ